ncbi:MAG: hypothetical protein J0M01_02170 [Dechloromonas sp.]|jgi:hypothetical protein|nr:hypothetical protein [Dechloromonas sp.]
MPNSTTHLDTIIQGQGSQDLKANALFDAIGPASLYGRRASTCSGLIWGYYGGNVSKATGGMDQIANGTLTLTVSTTNYIVANKETGAVSVSTATTNWNSADYWRLYSAVTGTATVTSYTDAREIGRMTGAGSGTVAPVTKTTAFTLGANENAVICNGAASITVTLPAASSWVGRQVRIKTIAAYTVVSASANVVPIDSATAGTAILAATAGKWAVLVSDGTNWVVMAAN